MTKQKRNTEMVKLQLKGMKPEGLKSNQPGKQVPTLFLKPYTHIEKEEVTYCSFKKGSPVQLEQF